MVIAIWVVCIDVFGVWYRKMTAVAMISSLPRDQIDSGDEVAKKQSID